LASIYKGPAAEGRNVYGDDGNGDADSNRDMPRRKNLEIRSSGAAVPITICQIKTSSGVFPWLFSSKAVVSSFLLVV